MFKYFLHVVQCLINFYCLPTEYNNAKMFWIILSFLAICVTVFLLTRWRLRQLIIGDLSSRFILVTGCDSGFGNLLVKKLDSIGVNVFAMCYTKEAVGIFKRTSSQRVIPLQLDVTKQENIDRIYEEVKSLLPCGKGKYYTCTKNAFVQL